MLLVASSGAASVAESVVAVLSAAVPMGIKPLGICHGKHLVTPSHIEKWLVVYVTSQQDMAGLNPLHQKNKFFHMTI